MVYTAEFLSRNAIIASALHTSICAALHSGRRDPRYPSYTRIHVIVQEQSDAVSDNGDTPGVPEFRYVNDIVRILRWTIRLRLSASLANAALGSLLHGADPSSGCTAKRWRWESLKRSLERPLLGLIAFVVKLSACYRSNVVYYRMRVWFLEENFELQTSVAR